MIFDWLRKGLIFILVVTLIAGAVAFLYSKYLITPTYRASVKLCASSSDLDSTMINYYQQVAPQYVELLNVNAFYEMVAEELLKNSKGYFSPGRLQSAISFSAVVENTGVFYARVTTNDPQTSYDIAEAVAACAPLRIKELKPNDVLIVVTPPQRPTSPASPNISRNTLYGALFGFLIAAALVVVKELLDSRIKSTDEITELYGMPVLGIVPDFSNQEKKGV